MLDLTPPSAILNRNIAKSCWYFPRYPPLFYDFMRWFYSNSILASALALYVLKKSYFKGRNIHGQKLSRFSRFWSNSRNSMPLKIIKSSKRESFSLRIKDFFPKYDFFYHILVFIYLFSRKTNNNLKNVKVFSSKFLPKITKRESFCQKFRVFKTREIVCLRKFLPLN